MHVGVGLFCHITSNRIRGNVLKVCQGSFRWDIRKNVFMERVFKHWNRLIKKVVESLTLERLKKHILKR